MKRFVVGAFLFGLGHSSGFWLAWWVLQPAPVLVEAPAVILRDTMPRPPEREEVSPPARYPTPGEMGVVEPYLKGEPR